MLKPGWKTTEFWMSVAAGVLGFVYASGIVVAQSPVDGWLGMIAAALTASGYAVARGLAKK